MSETIITITLPYKASVLTDVHEYMIMTKGDFRGRMVMADGWSVSVQASWGHYCTPRKSGADKYTHVEVGYPSAYDPILFAHGSESGDGKIFPYLPIEVVQQLADAHGGIVASIIGFGSDL